MLNKYKYEGKTEEETISKALEDLKENKENLIINVNLIDGNLFKSKKCEIEVIKKTDIVSFIKEYVLNLGDLMGLEINTEIREIDNIYSVQLICDNNAILIGKDGRTINAIQILLRQSLNNQTKENIKINLDVANYKNKKMQRLEYEIKKIAKEILNSKLDVSLDPMNSYERRTVHCIISEYENLATESTGEGLERHVVIKYIGE